MRTFFTFLICSIAFSFSSCKKLQDALTTDVTVSPKEMEFSILPQAQTTDEITLKSVQAIMNLDSLLQVNSPGLEGKNIKSIQLKSLQIRLSNADSTNNLANFQSLAARVEATGKSGVTIASVADNPNVYSTTANVPAEPGIELKDYLNAGSYKFILKGKIRKATTKILTGKVTAYYTVEVAMLSE